MNKQQVNTNDETDDPFAPIFEWAADRKAPHNLKEKYMLQDDAWKTYEVDTSQFFDSLEKARSSHPKIHDSRIWTVHEADDHQYWSSGTRGFVNRVGYYVAAKPVPSNLRIVTSSQCVYCDKEECICAKCSTCGQIEHCCECDD